MSGSGEFKESTLQRLAVPLFQGCERLGWEFRQPHPMRPCPQLPMEPTWLEPNVAGPQTVPKDLARRQALPRRVTICASLLVLGLALGKNGVVLDLIGLGLALFWFIPMISNANSAKDAQVQAVLQRDQRWAEFQRTWQAWKAGIDNWDRGEKARVDAADLWYPVTMGPSTRRLDVFGGTPSGWAALITTLGASALRQGGRLLVLDLTEHDVTRELLGLATIRELSTRVLDLPQQLPRVNLLSRLSAEEVAEVLAEAIHTGRTVEAADMRGIDADLIRAVCQRLDGELSFAKIAAGLQVLRQTWDEGNALLSPPELRRLTAYVDVIAHDPQAQRELPILVSCVELLTTGPSVSGEAGDLWGPSITVLRTGDQNPRRKDMTDRVLAQVLIHSLRRSASAAGDTLILAGSDHLGVRTLEGLARHATRSGLRAVVMVEHLRGELEQFLGGADSASLIMRLGNASEAARAAEYVGRGHQFLLNQMTRQFSEANTRGEAKQWGATNTVSEQSSWGGGTSADGGSSSNWSSSRGFSRADTWSRTVNWSTTDSTTDGTTVSRVYEFTVEPTEIQSLPISAFIFVEAADGHRRVLVGDCNPGIALLDRVAAGARGATSGQSLPGVDREINLGAVTDAARATAARIGPAPAGERSERPFDVEPERRPEEWRRGPGGVGR